MKKKTISDLTTEKTELKREIGAFGGVSIIGGIMIGSGIFYLGARTGLMSQGYMDDADNHGLEWISTEDMDRCCQLAKEHNLQVITHCIGDEAVRRTVGCYERAFVDGKNKLRHAVVHCQITDSELLDRIARDDVLVFAQPIFLDYDMNIVEKLRGKELASASSALHPSAQGRAPALRHRLPRGGLQSLPQPLHGHYPQG